MSEAQHLNFAVAASEIAAVCKREEPCALSDLKGFREYKPQERPQRKGTHPPPTMMQSIERRRNKTVGSREGRGLEETETRHESHEVERILGRPDWSESCYGTGLATWKYQTCDGTIVHRGTIEFIKNRVAKIQPKKWGD